jgi:transposase
MGKELVSDELWKIVEPLLPAESPKPRGGRPRMHDRAALVGIIYVLKSGIPWSMLPKELGCGSGTTCWRRLRDWQKAGAVCIWPALRRP